jgi:cytochrome oxidase Cu insertion factor (SCO1/SenC/PrrC family)
LLLLCPAGLSHVVRCTGRVYFSKTGEQGARDYLVDHSIIHYLVDPEGEFVTFYGGCRNQCTSGQLPLGGDMATM